MAPRNPLPGLVITLLTLSCSQGEGLPSAPSPRPPSEVRANVVATSSVSFGLCEVPSPGCSYSQEYTNTGLGCANNLRGKVKVYREESLLETDDWWLDPTFVIQAGATIPVEDCCFVENTVLRRTRTESEVFWNTVPCN